MRYIRTLLFIGILSQSLGMCAQHTEHFKELTKSLKSRKTVSFQNFYTEGSLKDEGTSRAYKMPEYTYHKTSGTYTTYYKTGELKSTSELDRFGNVLEAVYYNADGTTWWKAKTLSIDSKLSDAREYFIDPDHLIISKAIKEYKYSKELGTMYLFAEGTTMNNSKTGSWRFYDANGRLEEEKVF